jgi:microsomal dipeptidase-like Zn-dependent dipeptidase
MNKIIDLHSHLETLQKWASFRNLIQGHLYSIKGHHHPQYQTIISLAMYAQIYQGYDDIVLQIKNVKKEMATFGDQVRLITKKADLEGDYKVGIILHVESGRVITNPHVQLPHLYELGIRGIIPIHFKDNQLGNSCDDPFRRTKIKRIDNGMTEEGHRFITEMNRLGMWVDLAHTSDTTADQMLELAKEVMVSHVGIRDLVPRARNKGLNFLQKVAKKGGIFGLTPWQHLIGNDEDAYYNVLKLSLENNLKHAVCIGTDLGAPIKTHGTIKSMYDCGKVAENFSEEQMIKWENAFHFFERVLPD